MQSLLLTGASGQVGFELHRALAPLGSLVAATRDGRLPGGAACQALDLAQPATIKPLLDRLQPRIVINPAAYTAVDRAESEVQLARKVNVEAVDAIARWCRANDALMVHYSTDYVFDGSARSPWTEDAATAPLGVYGHSKRDGEAAVRASGARHLILRTAWVYAARGSNFMRTMLRLAAERDELRVVDDQYGSPTPARWIATATLALLSRLSLSADEAETLGTFHLTSAGCTSWHGFAAAIMQSAQRAGLLKATPRVIPIQSAEYPTAAKRPAYSVLDCERLQRVHGLSLPDWRAGLDHVVAELASAS